MKQLIANLHFYARWQIYGRVLPVIAVALLAVAAVAWLGYTHWSREAVTEAQTQNLRNLASVVRERAAFESAALEIVRLRRDPTGATLPNCNGFVAAVMAVRDGRPLEEASFVVIDSLDSPANRARLGACYSETRNRFHQGAVSRVSAGGGTGAASKTESASVDVRLFAPLLVWGPADPDTAAGTVALLPVIVDAPRTRRTVRFAPPTMVVFLDLRRLLQQEDRDLGWWCLVSPGGEVLLSSDGTPAPGSSFEAHGGLPQGRLGPGLSAAAVSGLADTADWRSHVLTGSSFDRWVVSRHLEYGLPFTVLGATRAYRMHDVALVYFAAVAGIAMLSLIVAMVGVTGVVDDVSLRLRALGTNMEALARGDYTRRIPRGRPDEVGRLVSFFNLMASSLEEAHRQVKERATRLKDALEKMRALDRAKDDFLVLVSHEVRTPLTAILGGISYLKSTVDDAVPADQETLQRLNLKEIAEIIAGSGERLNGFMNDAIQMTAIQSGDRKLELVPEEPVTILYDGLDRIRTRALARKISIDNRLDERCTWRVLCDREVLKVAFVKILDNAVVHNEDGGNIVIREARGVPGLGDAASLATPDQVHRLHEQPGFAEWGDLGVGWRIVEIRNTGAAIPRDRIDALFGKFELVGRIEHHSRGSGLSLPIAKAAVEQHGGRILVHSDESWGTSFYVLVPTLEGIPGERYPGESGHDAAEGLGRRAGHEEIRVAAHAAGLEIELDDDGAGGGGDGDETGGGVDGAGRPDYEEQLTV